MLKFFNYAPDWDKTHSRQIVAVAVLPTVNQFPELLIIPLLSPVGSIAGEVKTGKISLILPSSSRRFYLLTAVLDSSRHLHLRECIRVLAERERGRVW